MTITTDLVDAGCTSCRGKGYLELRINGRRTGKTTDCECVIAAVGSCEVPDDLEGSEPADQWSVLAGSNEKAVTLGE